MTSHGAPLQTRWPACETSAAAHPGAAELRRRRSARLVQHHPSDDTIVIELVEPADMPAVVRIVWPSAPTITTPAKLNEVAAEAMKILAYASTRYAQIRAQRRC